jgi:hypothetical protein
MIYGLILSVRLGQRATSDAGAAAYDSRSPDDRWPLVVLLYLYAATYSTIHLLSWAMHRYRLPVDAVMMVFVGLAWVDLYRRFNQWRGARMQRASPSSDGAALPF